MTEVPVQKRQALLFQSLVEDATDEYVRAYGVAPGSCSELIEKQFLFFAPAIVGDQEGAQNLGEAKLQKAATKSLAAADAESARWLSANELEEMRERLRLDLSQAGASGDFDRGYFFRSKAPADRRLYSFRTQMKTVVLYWGFVSHDSPPELQTILDAYGLAKAGTAWASANEQVDGGATPWSGTVAWNVANDSLRISLDPGLGKPLVLEARTEGDYAQSMQTQALSPGECALEAPVSYWDSIRLKDVTVSP